MSTPHEVFTIGLDDLAAGRGLEAARSVGWRYIVEAAGQPIASAETTVGADGTTHHLSQLNEGPYVEATALGVRAARQLPELEAAGFELRLLRIPAVYLMALWLHSPTTDLMVPLAPSPIGREGRITPLPAFMNDLSRLARSTNPPDRPGASGSHAP